MSEKLKKENDDAIDSIAKLLDEIDKNPAVINPRRIHDMKSAFDIVDKTFASSSVKISYKVNEPFKNMGSITLEGKNILFNDPKVFLEIATLANNVDIYPLVNGKIRMSFGFNDIAKYTVEDNA